MALRGKGMLVVLCEVAAAHEQDLSEWYNREHIAERIAIAGLRRGRRYAALDGGHRSLALYECGKVGDLASPAYVRKLAHGSAWTRRVTSRFTSFKRLALRMQIDLTHGDGGIMSCVRFVPDPRRRADLLSWLRGALAKTVRRPGVVGAAVGINDPAVVHAPARAQGRAVPDDEAIEWVLLLEASDAGAAEDAARALLTPAVRKRFGISAEPEAGTYRFAFGNER